MVLRLAGAFLLLAAATTQAGSRIVETALAVALLDVVDAHCRNEISVDEQRRAGVRASFRDYDVQGLQSLIAGPLNGFYEDFLAEVGRGRLSFCMKAPATAAAAGHAGLLKFR
jgi:hypothetical protein